MWRRRWQQPSAGVECSSARVDADERVVHEVEPHQGELDDVGVHGEREPGHARGGGGQGYRLEEGREGVRGGEEACAEEVRVEWERAERESAWMSALWSSALRRSRPDVTSAAWIRTIARASPPPHRDSRST